MSGLFWLSEAQLLRIELCFPLLYGVPRVDDRRVLSGIIFVIRNGLRWCDALRDYGLHKTICNRFVRWSHMGRVFDKIFAALAAQGSELDRLMIDATYLKAHRTAANLLEKGLPPHSIMDVSSALGAAANSRPHVVCDGQPTAGPAARRRLMSDYKGAMLMIDALPENQGAARRQGL